MTSSININKRLIILFSLSVCTAIVLFLFTGCGAPMQDGMVQDNNCDSIDTAAAVEINIGSAVEQVDTIVTTKPEVVIPEATVPKIKKDNVETPVIEPSKTSEPIMMVPNQVQQDTFFVKQTQHNDEDSSLAHKKKCYQIQSIKVKGINDTIKSIDEKFQRIEQRIKMNRKK